MGHATTTIAEAAPIEPPPSGPPRRRAWWKRWRLPLPFAVLGWIVIGALALLALLRVVAWDDAEPLAVLNAANGLPYALVWPVAVAALLGRRLVLGAAALLVVVAQVLFVLPELSAAAPPPGWATRAPKLQLLDANVNDENNSMAGYGAQIRSLRPELVTMEEANPADVAQLEAAHALAGLPYRYEVQRYDPFAFFIASRFPLTGTNVVSLFGRPLIVRTTLELPSGPQPLWVVHTVAPVPGSFGQWRSQLATISALVRRTPGRSHLLVVGDFNATWGNEGFAAILDAGLSDGAAVRGDALDMTWSQQFTLAPPLVRVDHVLTGSEVAVTSITTGPGPGSDHRELRATLAVRP